MGRPNSLSPWWKALAQVKANDSVALLATLLEINVRTLHRWQTLDIQIPGLKHRNRIKLVAGKDMLQRADTPKYLRFKPKPIPRGRHASARTN